MLIINNMVDYGTYYIYYYNLIGWMMPPQEDKIIQSSYDKNSVGY